MMSEAYVPKPGEKRLVLDLSRCTYDHVCMPTRVCPVEAIRRAEGEPPAIDHRTCLVCGACLKVCPNKALSIQRD